MKYQFFSLFPLYILLVLIVVYFSAGPLVMTILPPCPFHTITGLYCPGCGSQRAFTALLHGHILQAIGYNILFVTSIPVLATGLFYNHARFRPNRLQKFWYSPVFAVTLLLVVLVFWIIRNLPMYPFNMLAP